jgi:2-methylcitrate dehydratase PrpD
MKSLETKEMGTPKLTEKLSEFVVAFTLFDAPKQAIENAKTVILDCLGVSVLAATQEIGAAVRSFAEIDISSGPCTVWGTRITARPRDAALLNGILAHGLDYDDGNHSTTYCLATAFALGEGYDLTGRQVLESFIVAREISNSLHGIFEDRNSGIGPGAKGWHSNGILGPIASACAAAKLLNLDFTHTLSAIGLAAGSCGALTRDGGTMAKPFRVGHAAATGVTCALLAQSGFSSDDQILEGRFGLLEALGPLPESLLDSLGENLGQIFDLASEVRGKRYAACWGSKGGLEAMLRLVCNRPIEPSQVSEITCDLKPYPLIRHIPKRGIEGRFSMPFCLALGLVHGTVTPYDFTNENVRDPVIQDLMSRTRHVPNASQLTVTLKDGQVLTEPLMRRGSLKTREEIVGKFRYNVRNVLSDQQAERVIQSICTLEIVKSARNVTEDLRAVAESVTS